MDKDQKTLIFNLRKNLERGEAPTKKSIYNLLDLVVELDRKLSQQITMLGVQEIETETLKKRLGEIKDAVQAKVEEVFL